ncbi:unnamed protein product, partial [marine sediment metagenome]
DHEAMLDRYGIYATYRGKYLDDIMKRTTTLFDYAEGSDEDYRPSERRQRIIEDVEARRAGEMIYQRGR